MDESQVIKAQLLLSSCSASNFYNITFNWKLEEVEESLLLPEIKLNRDDRLNNNETSCNLNQLSTMQGALQIIMHSFVVKGDHVGCFFILFFY